MKISISNIAWPHEEETRVLEYLADADVSAVEIAPSRIWSDFTATTSEQRRTYLNMLRNEGFTICSMHSLYFKQRNMSLFGDSTEQSLFDTYTRELINLANDLEIPRMILGSPSIRKRGSLSKDEAMECAANVLTPLADYAYSRGTKILIEALSTEETDFVNSHLEAQTLVDSVNSNGFGLHLDAKAISREQDNLCTIFKDCDGQVEHFHVNEIGLGGFDDPRLNHEVMAEYLRESKFNGFVSVEMRQMPDYMTAIETAICFVSGVYC